MTHCSHTLDSRCITRTKLLLLHFFPPVLLLGIFLYTRWRSYKGMKEGVYHVSAHHDGWEDIRENVLNYDEEGGGEEDQVSDTHKYICEEIKSVEQMWSQMDNNVNYCALEGKSLVSEDIGEHRCWRCQRAGSVPPVHFITLEKERSSGCANNLIKW